MDSRERFRQTMGYGRPDRVPYFHEGMEEDVIQEWRKQGLPPDADLYEIFGFDRREEFEPDLEALPGFRNWPSTLSDLHRLRGALNPNGNSRFPRRWNTLVQKWRTRKHPLFLRVHRGFFLSMGVEGWKRFREVMFLTLRDPKFVREAMRIQGEFSAQIAERALREAEFDAVVFTEPIAESRGPLISPKMYEDLVLRSYEPVLAVLRRYRVGTVILLTFANIRSLLPSIVKWGFNCLWACEVPQKDMDYRDLRREFGRDLRLIGGIDLDVLRLDKESIKREVYEKVPPLLADGGFIPLADGRVRKDIPLENYLHYRHLFKEVTQANTSRRIQ
jgi:Uroporphyrinogen decarboxylase (URO-D)